MKGIKKSLAGVAMLGLVSMSLVQLAPAAVAKDGDIERRGNCSSGTEWKIKLSPEDGRIEVEYEVDQNQNGQTWSVKMKDNGVRFYKGKKTTAPPSGSFEVRSVTADLKGKDRIVATANNPKTGETCKGSATF